MHGQNTRWVWTKFGIELSIYSGKVIDEGQ